jgi:hypothetical protein
LVFPHLLVSLTDVPFLLLFYLYAHVASVFPDLSSFSLSFLTSVGAREYGDRNRLRVHQQALSPFVMLLNNNKCVDGHTPEKLTDFLLTSSWRPNEVTSNALSFDGFTGSASLPVAFLPASPDLSDLKEITQEVFPPSSPTCCCPSTSETLPLEWSAGLLIHPDYLQANTDYICSSGLCTNSSLCIIPCLPFVNCLCSYSCLSLCNGKEQLHHVLKGQSYCGLSMQTYKKPSSGLILSSFKVFQPHTTTSFQQVSWMGNLAGIPLWSQSGRGNEKLLGFDVFNTHNPAVLQAADILLVTSLTPYYLNSWPLKVMFGANSRLYWALPFFQDNHIVVPYSSSNNNNNSNNSNNSNKNLNSNDSPSSAAAAAAAEDTKERSSIETGARLSKVDEKNLASADMYWCVAERKNDTNAAAATVYVAVLCTKSVKVDYSKTKDSTFISKKTPEQMKEEAEKVKKAEEELLEAAREKEMAAEDNLKMEDIYVSREILEDDEVTEDVENGKDVVDDAAEEKTDGESNDRKSPMKAKAKGKYDEDIVIGFFKSQYKRVKAIGKEKSNNNKALEKKSSAIPVSDTAREHENPDDDVVVRYLKNQYHEHQREKRAKQQREAAAKEAKRDKSIMETTLPRLCCSDPYHSWIIVVGTSSEYSSINDLIHRKVKNIKITETVFGQSSVNTYANALRGSYKIIVKEEPSAAVTGGVGVKEGKEIVYHYDLKEKTILHADVKC